MRSSLRRVACALMLSMIATVAGAQTGESIFGNDFDPPFAFPNGDGEAARFLNQTTFGATRPEIAQVRTAGYDSWLTQHSGCPPRCTASRWSNSRPVSPVVQQSTRTIAGVASGRWL